MKMNSIGHLPLISISLFMFKVVADTEVDIKKIQCLVCKAVVEKIQNEVEKISPNRKVDISHYRLDNEGNSAKNKIEYRRSEVFLSGVFDEVCNSMEEWVKGTRKSDGQLVIFSIMTEDNKMNPLFSEVDIIQDSNLNKNIKLYCEMIFEEQEDALLELFRSGSSDIDTKLCSNIAGLCNDTLQLEEERIFQEEKDEL